MNAMGASKRAYERKTAQAPVRLTPIEWDGRIGACVPGVMSDLSRGGACVIVRRLLHAGSIAVLEIPNADGAFRRVVEVRGVGYELGVGTQLGLMFRTDADATALLARYVMDNALGKGAA